MAPSPRLGDMKRIDFIYFDAGGGHRAAATALQEAIGRQNRPWEVRLVNLQELLDELDVCRKITGARMEDVYNFMLKKGWTMFSPPALRVIHKLFHFYYREQVTLMRKFWSAGPPDMMVSFVPHFNRALADTLHALKPHARYVTVITDFADYPPHYWVDSPLQYMVVGSAKAERQVAAFGIPPRQVYRVSGMIVHPRFYEPVTVDAKAERARLGLDPELPTGLVLFGGQGSEAMYGIARRLNQSALPVQLILICGRNFELAERLRNLRTRYPKLVEGFTREVPYYMHLSDYFIGKPGPGSISEAIRMNLPVIVERNLSTMPQERYNTEWVKENQVGLVVRSYRRIVPAVNELLQPGNLERFRCKAAAMENRAVFEIPEFMEKILAEAE